MRGHRAPAHYCTACGRENDATRNVDGTQAPPDDGDLSLCIGCAALSAFVVVDGVIMGVRALTEHEAERAHADSSIRSAQKYVRLMRYVNRE